MEPVFTPLATRRKRLHDTALASANVPPSFNSINAEGSTACDTQIMFNHGCVIEHGNPGPNRTAACLRRARLSER
jgi:hypothetical protein